MAPKLTLVFEYCDYDLKKFLESQSSKKLDVGDTRHILRQILRGLEYMHRRSVVHRDMKPQNVLITSSKVAKLADFGLARVEGIPVKKYSHEAVTLWYRPPDVILGSTNYGFAVDIWSTGCIFAEMLLGQPLFNGHSDAEQLQKMFSLLGTPTTDNFPSYTKYPNYRSIVAEARNGAFDQILPSSLKAYVSKTSLLQLGEPGCDLLARMLEYEPSRRITAREALMHPFLREDDMLASREVLTQQCAYLQKVIDGLDAMKDHDRRVFQPQPPLQAK